MINYHDNVKRADITMTLIKINAGITESELSAKPIS